MRRTLAAVMIAAAAVSADAQTPASETVKTELRAFLAELNAALQSRDRPTLERLYAPEFIFIHTLGPPVERAEHLATTMKTPPRGSIPVPSLDGLMVIGDVALLRTREEERISTSIWAKRNGQWQVLQIQVTVLPPSRSVPSVPAELLRTYAGRYLQDNGVFVNIAVEGNHLTLQADGRTKFVLSARSETEFSLPGDAVRITFGPGGSYEFKRPNQPVLKGQKQ